MYIVASLMEVPMKTHIRLVLAGGGTRCAFQLKFIERLFKDERYKETHEIDHIYGTSFGAFVGLFICIDRIDLIHDFFMNLNNNSLKPWFNLWGFDRYFRCLPIIGSFFGVLIDIVWLLISIKKKSMYSPSYGSDFLQLVDIHDEETKEKLRNFSCCVYNVTKGRTEFINGTHVLIKDYIIASASLWIVFPPVTIRQLKTECVCSLSLGCDCQTDCESVFCTCANKTHQFNEYIDGGILKPIPLPTLLHESSSLFTGTYYVITTKNFYDIVNKDLKFNHTGSHLFDYLDKIINYLIDYVQHMEISYVSENWVSHKNVKLINYNLSSDVSPTILDKEIIQGYMRDGEKFAEQFLATEFVDNK